MTLQSPATPDQVLAATSRTFMLPIRELPSGLREAVTAAYLCLRAIDEIEDHEALLMCDKAALLQRVGELLGLDSGLPAAELGVLFAGHAADLDEVTLRLHEWVALAPPGVAPRVCAATAEMAARMREWSLAGWQVHTEADLDRYTFDVAGAVGVLLSEIWLWYDGTTTSRDDAIGLGRGLQAVNILRNRADDLGRGVDFFPDGWRSCDVHGYARSNLALGERYVEGLRRGPIRVFCQLPLALATATLDALLRGEVKLTRTAVLRIVRDVRAS